MSKPGKTVCAGKSRFAGLVVLLFLTGWLQGQVLKEGSTYTHARIFRPVKFAGIAQGNLYLVRGVTDDRLHLLRDVQLEWFDTTLLAKKGELTFPRLYEDRQQFYPEDIIVWNDSLRLLGSAYDKERKTNRLMVRGLDTEGKLTAGKELFSCETAGYEATRRRFHIRTNAPENILMVLALNEIARGRETELNLALLGKKLNIVKRMRTRLPHPPGASPGIIAATVDEPGNVHLLLRWRNMADTSDIRYSLYAFPVMTEEVVEYQLDIPGKQITSLSMGLSDDDHILLAGLLRESFRASPEASGLFFLRINRETGAIASKSVKQIDTDFLGLFAGEDPRPARKNFENFVVQQLRPTADGGALLYAEQQHSNEKCETDPRTGMVECRQHYFRNTLLVVRFNSLAGTDWFQQVAKQQHSIDDEGIYLSYLLRSGPGGDEFLFNGAQEKTRRKEDPVMDDPQRSRLSLIRLNGSGQQHSVSTGIKEPFPVLPGVSFRDRNGNLLFLGERNGRSVIYRLR